MKHNAILLSFLKMHITGVLNNAGIVQNYIIKKFWIRNLSRTLQTQESNHIESKARVYKIVLNKKLVAKYIPGQCQILNNLVMKVNLNRNNMKVSIGVFLSGTWWSQILLKISLILRLMWKICL